MFHPAFVIDAPTSHMTRSMKNTAVTAATAMPRFTRGALSWSGLNEVARSPTSTVLFPPACAPGNTWTLLIALLSLLFPSLTVSRTK